MITDNVNRKYMNLEEMYRNMMESMSTHTQNTDFSTWEKSGDMYKQYSIYDTSKYDTMLSSDIVVKKGE